MRLCAGQRLAKIAGQLPWDLKPIQGAVFPECVHWENAAALRTSQIDYARRLIDILVSSPRQ